VFFSEFSQHFSLIVDASETVIRIILEKMGRIRILSMKMTMIQLNLTKLRLLSVKEFILRSSQ
jgi:hypothetical protein